MYEGSMYLMVTSLSFFWKNSLMAEVMNSPIFGSFLLPLLSVSFAMSVISSSPAPSATTTTACPFFSMTRCRCGRMPFGPSSITLTSGIRHRSTPLPIDIVAKTEINPALLPMSFTMPIPFGMLELASTFAAKIAFFASSTAVRKPNERSMRPMSLSIVFGIPHTAMFFRRSMQYSLTLKAPRCVPSPPAMKSIDTLFFSRNAEILSRSKPPRVEPRIVPPRCCMSATASGVRTIGRNSAP
mmetsp:Transcript_22680/g.57464  ORF Transcript_22680/g.57464 Transcript_22680/m.57464 type:complete len:241 (+) Transcript_22680:630-1352(+)